MQVALRVHPAGATCNPQDKRWWIRQSEIEDSEEKGEKEHVAAYGLDIL